MMISRRSKDFTPLEASYFNNRRNKSFGLLTGFTLIEMLMVISLVSLLASIVMATIGNAKEKARIAAVLRFSSSIRAQIYNSLVSHWSFNDGTAKDNWGNNDGILENGAAVNNNGVISRALELDGDDDYVHIDYNDSLNIIQKLTIETWVKRNSDSGEFERMITKQAYNNGKYLQYFLQITDKGTVEFGVGNSLEENYDTTYHVGEIIIAPDIWHHIVAVYDGYELKQYVNGIFDVSLDASQDTIIKDEENGALYIGRYEERGTGFFEYGFNGLIDEVRIYNAALTAQEIQKLYAESAPRHGIVISND